MKSRQGQVVVELAIILPLAFLILFTLAELCFLFNARQLLQLGSFQAARSYVVMKNKSAAELCLFSALKSVVFRDPVNKVAALEIFESSDRVTVNVVVLYRPVFPILPLARFLNIAFSPDHNSVMVSRMIKAQSAKGWSILAESRIPISASTELVK